LHQIIVVERKLLTQQAWDDMFSFERLINTDLLEG
jgi:aspartate ammonia-lyase